MIQGDILENETDISTKEDDYLDQVLKMGD